MKVGSKPVRQHSTFRSFFSFSFLPSFFKPRVIRAPLTPTEPILNRTACPFGPKRSSHIIPPKTFENCEIEPAFLQNYQILCNIGHGAYTVVKFATHKLTGMKVAIKIYEKVKIQDPIRSKSVKREIRILKALHHQNVIKLIEVITGEKSLYLVMEHFKGKGLGNYLANSPTGRLEEAEAVEIFQQLLKALAHCHSLNVAHRDIKMENLMLSAERELKLIDFGFGTMTKKKDKKNCIYCGTPNYLAPEIIRKVNFNGLIADMWAAGVVLYVMVTGVFPFASTPQENVLDIVLKNKLELPDRLSVQCRDIIKQMLDPDPSTRLTAIQALEHPWTKSFNPPTALL